MTYLKIKLTKRKACRRKIRPHAPVKLDSFKRSHTGYVLTTNRAILALPNGVNKLVLIEKLVDAPFRQNVKKKVLTKSSVVRLVGQEGLFRIISKCARDPLLVRPLDGS